MAQGCLKCLKYTMCFANFLCFICGVAVLSFGAYLMVNFRMAALTPTLTKFNVANMLLVSGIVITCVSFLGFLGALKENRCLLLTFFLLLFFLMLVELTAACLLLMYETEISSLLKDDLINGLEKAKEKEKEKGNSTSAITTEWDVVQKQLACCGVNGTADWGGKVPESCCVKDCGTREPQHAKEGCLEKLKKLFEENFLTTGISVIVLCIIEVLGMCFAMTLFCHISRSGLGYKL
ncbi:leukocyte surface antigen CD53-like [Plectropomus leopardus]|uniref:leukocyte surface antigen CD53-like n=1 Tax=Plectropomus leopardus TaxID=160734 RepID=UPI001C4BE733|nr:leukocyte surface antigen CD53-like [Plectropomus leopardus]